jgi:hypothetical protein
VDFLGCSVFTGSLWFNVGGMMLTYVLRAADSLPRAEKASWLYIRRSHGSSQPRPITQNQMQIFSVDSFFNLGKQNIIAIQTQASREGGLLPLECLL